MLTDLVAVFRTNQQAGKWEPHAQLVEVDSRLTDRHAAEERSHCLIAAHIKITPGLSTWAPSLGRCRSSAVVSGLGHHSVRIKTNAAGCKRMRDAAGIAWWSCHQSFAARIPRA
jgi:hypothetical protein